MKVYYHGVAPQDRGHFLYDPSWTTLYRSNHPWASEQGDSYQLDGKLCPTTSEYQVEGHCALHHKDGWTKSRT